MGQKIVTEVDRATVPRTASDLPARTPTAIPPPETEVFDINRVNLAALRRVVDRLQVMD
ncbi:hypothetical protein [Parafrankia sp. BMG5.11]|uniref:hypothetical protein n=1 Tax=Parafrankia sp. BMG5.11 TaxID=222540 RepID=UPI001404DFA2|nr:hypothetical protein [Parafrankia sp. BMG5.11]